MQTLDVVVTENHSSCLTVNTEEILDVEFWLSLYEEFVVSELTESFQVMKGTDFDPTQVERVGYDLMYKGKVCGSVQPREEGHRIRGNDYFLGPFKTAFEQAAGTEDPQAECRVALSSIIEKITSGEYQLGKVTHIPLKPGPGLEVSDHALNYGEWQC